MCPQNPQKPAFLGQNRELYLNMEIAQICHFLRDLEKIGSITVGYIMKFMVVLTNYVTSLNTCLLMGYMLIECDQTGPKSIFLGPKTETILVL